MGIQVLWLLQTKKLKRQILNYNHVICHLSAIILGGVLCWGASSMFVKGKLESWKKFRLPLPHPSLLAFLRRTTRRGELIDFFQWHGKLKQPFQWPCTKLTMNIREKQIGCCPTASCQKIQQAIGRSLGIPSELTKISLPGSIISFLRVALRRPATKPREIASSHKLKAVGHWEERLISWSHQQRNKLGKFQLKIQAFKVIQFVLWGFGPIKIANPTLKHPT